MLGCELLQDVVEAAGFDQVGDNDRVTGGSAGPHRLVFHDQVGIDRIEPKFCTAGDQ